MALLAQKLNLSPGMKVLDIGCGFGGLAKLLAVRCGVSVVGITLSKEQAAFAQLKMPHPKVGQVEDHHHHHRHHHRHRRTDTHTTRSKPLLTLRR